MRRVCTVLLAALTLVLLWGCAPAMEQPVGEMQPEEGIAYYLTHAPSGMLLADADGALVATDSPSERGLWLFLPVDGGYVAQNEATGAYLSVDDSGAPIASADRERAIGWRLERLASGGCRCVASGDAEGFLSLSEGKASLSATSERWEIRPLTLRLNAYYDEAFAETYAKKGVYAVDALEKILLENTEGDENWRGLTQFLRQELHALIDLRITDAPYASYPYSAGCLYCNDLSTPCNNCFGVRTEGNSELDDCMDGYHHKEGTRFIESTPQSDAEYNIFFTGFAASCYIDKSVSEWTHSSGDGSAMFGCSEGIGTGNRCAVYLGAFSDILDYEHVKYIAVHELCHLLGARHHAPSVACLHSLMDISSAPEIAELTQSFLTLCDTCRAAIDCAKASLLYGHGD